MQTETKPEETPLAAAEAAPESDGQSANAKKKRNRGKKKDTPPATRTGPRPMRRLEEGVIRARRLEFKRRLAKHLRLSESAEKLIGKYEHELSCRGLSLDADAMDTGAPKDAAPAPAEGTAADAVQ
eukprot:301598-Rhodomonas_salina.1